MDRFITWSCWSPGSCENSTAFQATGRSRISKANTCSSRVLAHLLYRRKGTKSWTSRNLISCYLSMGSLLVLITPPDLFTYSLRLSPLTLMILKILNCFIFTSFSTSSPCFYCLPQTISSMALIIWQWPGRKKKINPIVINNFSYRPHAYRMNPEPRLRKSPRCRGVNSSRDRDATGPPETNHIG